MLTERFCANHLGVFEADLIVMSTTYSLDCHIEISARGQVEQYFGATIWSEICVVIASILFEADFKSSLKIIHIPLQLNAR